ncbi:hypothetical protein BJ165DRAFT_1426743, partial [Panaeolus papilionaceus]
MLQRRVGGRCARIVERRCLTCGARDEHSTWSCSITKVRFTLFIYRLEKICSLQNCPNGRSGCAMIPLLSRQRKSRFFAQECSTLWRIYKY